MGRIVDLCGEIAAAAEEGPEGLLLPPDVWDQLRATWSDEDIEDALGLVRDALLQSELVESADNLSARLVEILGVFGEDQHWPDAAADRAVLTIDLIRQLAHRVDRLEEILDLFRDGRVPERSGFERLRRRLMDQGIEDEMRPDWERLAAGEGRDE